MSTTITHVVFDLGGVVVKLKGTPIPIEWFPHNDKPEDVWVRWLTSEVPRQFESGKIGVQEFSTRLVSDFNLTCHADDFISYFKGLPDSVFPGVKTLLAEVRQNYTIACFSNSNELHWPIKMEDMGLRAEFDHHFASHKMGLIKPDAKSFEAIIEAVGVSPQCILFFDDNQLNVDAARAVGMSAERVFGTEELRTKLKTLTLIA